MPYKVVGKDVMKNEHGRWHTMEHAKNHENALKAVRLLYGIEHGWIPTHKKKKKKRGVRL